MKPVNKRLLIAGVAIGIFLCTMIAGVVQIRLLINKILTDRNKGTYAYYSIYTKIGEGYSTMNMTKVRPILDALPEDIAKSFEALDSSSIKEVKYNDEIISSSIELTDENFLKVNNMSIIKGRFFDKKDCDNSEKVCVIHEGMYNTLGKGEDITLYFNNEAFHVIGVISGLPAENSNLNSPYMPLDEVILMPMNTYFKYFTDFGPDQCGLIDQIIIKTPRTYTKEYLENKINPYASGLPGSLTVKEAGEEEKAELMNTLDIAGKVLLVAGLVLFIAVLNIIHITTANLYDIRKEIGLKMALGATRLDIIKGISLDIFLCTLKGGYIGVALYAILFSVINKYIRDYSSLEEILSPILKSYTEYFKLTFNIETVIIGITLSMLIGIVSAIIPAVKSASIDPIAVLRKE